MNGSGSTWSQIAIDTWRVDVASQGITINYQGFGSSAGRQNYYTGSSDFAVSEIPFQKAQKDATGTVVTDEIALAAKRPYAYLPIVAGGTSFMYHLTIGGQLIKDLKLSPSTIAKIFTGRIKNWNDPAITADDGRTFPDLPVKPVIRSDGSGTSAQFTLFMKSVTADVWSAFCAEQGLDPCDATSIYPVFSGSIAKPFSTGVADEVAAPYSNGAITYVEYGYAKGKGYPVVAVKNASGHFVTPQAVNVAVALQKATLNDDLTQNLAGVYAAADPRAYPVSSYSYAIVPTDTTAPFSADKGTVLSKFILYFLCAGQQKAAQLGYSPLPKNLVQAGFDQVAKIPGHVDLPAIDSCSNPTITGDFFVSGDGGPGTATTSTTAPTGTKTGTATTLSPTTTRAGSAGAGATTTVASTASTAGGSVTSVDPATSGGDEAVADGSGTGDGADAADATADGAPADGSTGGSDLGTSGRVLAAAPATLPPGPPPGNPFLVILVVLAALACVFAPPVLANHLDRR